MCSFSPSSPARAPTTEEDKKAAEKKREDKAKKKHDRKSKRLDEEEEDNEGGEWERVRGGVPLVKVSIVKRSDGRCPPGWSERSLKQEQVPVDICVTRYVIRF